MPMFPKHCSSGWETIWYWIWYWSCFLPSWSELQYLQNKLALMMDQDTKIH